MDVGGQRGDKAIVVPAAMLVVEVPIDDLQVDPSNPPGKMKLLTIDPASGLATVATCADPNSTFNANVLISASAQGFHGIIIGYANFVEQEPAPPKTAVVKSLTVTRLSGASSAMNGMARFIAVGKTEDGTLVPLNGKIEWSSSNPQAVRVDAGTGVARSMTAGKATVTATYTGTTEAAP